MKTVKFSRTREHRELMLRNLATSLVLYEKIKTTHAKAKAVKILVEKMITRDKKTVKKEAETIVTKKGKVTIRTKTSGSKVEVAEKIAKTKKEKITKKPAIAIKTIKKTEDKKGWLDRVSGTGLGKKFSQATKKIWTKRTTSK